LAHVVVKEIRPKQKLNFFRWLGRCSLRHKLDSICKTEVANKRRNHYTPKSGGEPQSCSVDRRACPHPSAKVYLKQLRGPNSALDSYDIITNRNNRGGANSFAISFLRGRD